MPIIELKNFGPFKEARLEWQPGQTVMIVGANGLGKSMLVLALQQLLTGTHYLSEDAEAENLVHYGQEGYRLVWQDENFEISESRENDSPKCEFWLDGKLYEGRPNGSKGSRVSEHRQAIDDLFGLSGLTRKQAAEIFLRRVLISPETNSLFNMRDAELTSYLLAAFNVEGVKERRRCIMDEKNKLKNELDGVQRIKAPELKVEDETVLQAEIDRLKKLTEGVNPPSMLPRMQAGLLQHQQSLNGMFAEREAMLAEYKNLLDAHTEYKDTNIEVLTRKLGWLRDPAAILHDILKQDESLKKEVETFKSESYPKITRISLLNEEIEQRKKTVGCKHLENRDVLAYDLKNVSDALASIDTNSIAHCPTCGRLIQCECGSTFVIAFDTLKEFGLAKQNRDELSKQQDDLSAKIVLINRTEERDKLKAEYDKLFFSYNSKCEEIKIKLKGLHTELEESEKFNDDWKILENTKAYNETKKKYDELFREVAEEKTALDRRITELELEIDSTKRWSSKFEEIESLNTRLITSQANRAALVEYNKSKEQVYSLEAEILDHERVIKDLPIFMRQQISQKSGLLAHRANLILNQIGGKGDIRFNPGDDEEIKKIVIEQQQYGVWNKIRTGGSSYSEQRLIAFSLLLAQHELYDTYFKPVDLIIQDDIFAGIDANRQELLARWVKNVSKSTQIILTSYDVEQWVNPDRLYRLVKDGDSTILKVE